MDLCLVVKYLPWNWKMFKVYQLSWFSSTWPGMLGQRCHLGCAAAAAAGVERLRAFTYFLHYGLVECLLTQGSFLRFCERVLVKLAFGLFGFWLEIVSGVMIRFSFLIMSAWQYKESRYSIVDNIDNKRLRDFLENCFAGGVTFNLCEFLPTRAPKLFAICLEGQAKYP